MSEKRHYVNQRLAKRCFKLRIDRRAALAARVEVHEPEKDE